MEPIITSKNAMNSVMDPAPRLIHTGNTCQIKHIPTKARGITINMPTTAGKICSRSGANQRPAKNPRTTVGKASMISTTGFTKERIFGAINMAV